MKRLSRPGEGEILLLTASRLLDGRIVWLGEGEHWRESIAEATRFTYEDAGAALERALAEAEQKEVVAVYEVVAKDTQPPEPVTTREAIRAHGPSVHPDFSYDHAPVREKESAL
ncbi:DUF2849 domain-containing protein [Bombella sp. TMW 2.2543]|uniref:DUF2849 domain-containing protein n=1 Tax=Bombella pluederhausensis TaxID=2967336 RepID=A0ABT3WHT8_9PROT|nr:DUF2849 domain-containing protein [Bombella pluederhausensis]MCX5618687.1 DUF2849 domain-containing protein [Bombella pluederhausensis]